MARHLWENIFTLRRLFSCRRLALALEYATAWFVVHRNPSIFGAILSASAQPKVVMKAPRGSQFALHASVVSLILDFSNLA